MPPSAAAQALLDSFGHIVIVNLPERRDRRHAIDAELRRVGLSLEHPAVELFPAIRPPETGGFPSVGAHGAFLSHRAVTARLLSSGRPRQLVLEDDMGFTRDAPERLPGLAADLATRDWAFLYGHGGTGSGGGAGIGGKGVGLTRLAPLKRMIQLHFFAITREGAEAALPMLDAMLTRPPGSPEGGPMHVDGAFNWVRAAHPGLTALGICPPIARQRPSSSDVSPGHWFDQVPGLRQIANTLRALR